jgi:hypothetical protein
MGMFLTWTLLKTIAKRILPVLPRHLILEKEQVLIHVRTVRKGKSRYECGNLKRTLVAKGRLL